MLGVGDVFLVTELTNFYSFKRGETIVILKRGDVGFVLGASTYGNMTFLRVFAKGQQGLMWNRAPVEKW